MTTQEKLLAALFAKFPDDSETAIAKRCGLSIARFSNYKLGKREMDVDAVIGCAQVLEWDVRATVASHMQEAAGSPRERAMWRKLAATAAALLCAVGLTMATPEKANAFNSLKDSMSAQNSPSMYIMFKSGPGTTGTLLSLQPIAPKQSRIESLAVEVPLGFQERLLEIRGGCCT